MINIIFTLSISQPLSDEMKSELTAAGCSWVSEIPEMPNQGQIIPIQAYVPSVELMNAVKQQLDALDTRSQIEIIGVWNEDGTLYDPINFPFNLTAYAAYLSGSPAPEEAVNIQVNRFAGMPDRLFVVD